MGQQPPDFVVEHADELPSLGHRDAEQLLNRKAKGVLLVHRRDIVEPVEVGDGLQVRLVLDELFGSAVEKPNVRVDPLDDLAIKLENKTEHAVGCRMLRAKLMVKLRRLCSAMVRL